jgi:hypothetical protein
MSDIRQNFIAFQWRGDDYKVFIEKGELWLSDYRETHILNDSIAWNADLIIAAFVAATDGFLKGSFRADRDVLEEWKERALYAEQAHLNLVETIRHWISDYD